VLIDVILTLLLYDKPFSLSTNQILDQEMHRLSPTASGTIFQGVPPELKDLIKFHEQALREIAVLQFTLEELRWLAIKKDVITFFRSPDAVGISARTKLIRCDTKTVPGALLVVEQTAMYSSEKVTYHFSTNKQNIDDSIWKTTLELVAESNYSIIPIALRPQKSFYILDIASVFLLFHRRFSNLGLSNPIPAAEKKL